MKIVNIEDINPLEPGAVVTVGMFDGLHAGHRHLLHRLLEEADRRTLRPVVVTFDRHPRQVVDAAAPPALLSTHDERMRLLAACGVPTVALVHFTPLTAALSACTFARRFLCRRLNMRTLLLGYDNMFGSRTNNDFDRLPQLAAEMGFDICRDDVVTVDGIEVSSTKIRHALLAGDLQRANALLGSPYSLDGTVVHGRHVGTGLGFPTANIVPDDSAKLLPAEGVYALRASLDGRQMPAMANLGTQPTFHNDKPVLEVHLIGFDGDLYGQRLTVEFIDRLRDTRPFDSPDALRRQLERDKVDALRRLGLPLPTPKPEK